MPQYSYALDHAELARYDAMAARAVEHEADLWDMAGILMGAAVVDLGCGPGAFLAAFAARTAPSGTVVGVDNAGTPSQPPKRWSTSAISSTPCGSCTPQRSTPASNPHPTT
jgi:predicted methyltransferase